MKPWQKVPASWDRTEMYVVAACLVVLVLMSANRAWRAWCRR